MNRSLAYRNPRQVVLPSSDVERHRYKRLITGKRQPGRPGRSDNGKSGRKLEEIAEMKGATPAKQKKVTQKPTCGKGRGRGVRKKSK